MVFCDMVIRAFVVCKDGMGAAFAIVTLYLSVLYVCWAKNTNSGVGGFMRGAEEKKTCQKYPLSAVAEPNSNDPQLHIRCSLAKAITLESF